MINSEVFKGVKDIYDYGLRTTYKNGLKFEYVPYKVFSFEYEYDIWCDKCYLLLDGLREKYDNVEVVVAHLSYGEFMNAEEFKEYADEVEKYSIKVCECDDCGEIKKTRFQIEIENDVKRLNEIYEKVERITPSNMDKMGGRR